jgi:hypothetical protein
MPQCSAAVTCFAYITRGSWSRKRRVIGKAEATGGEADPRFIVTSLYTAEVGASEPLPNQPIAWRTSARARISDDSSRRFRPAQCGGRRNWMPLPVRTAWLLQGTALTSAVRKARR